MDAQSGQIDHDDVTEDEHAQLRASPRDSMLLGGTMRRVSGGGAVPIKIRNLSAGGLMAECQGAFVRDDVIEVDLRGIGMVPGRIAWVGGGRVGVAFDREIDPKLARKPVIGNPQPQFVKPAAAMWRPKLR